MIDWCIRSGLVSELSEAALRVMALDPVPWMTKGRPEKAALADGVARAVGIARRLQTVVSGRCVSRDGITQHGLVNGAVTGFSRHASETCHPAISCYMPMTLCAGKATNKVQLVEAWPACSCCSQD
jgi:hypothetical protein